MKDCDAKPVMVRSGRVVGAWTGRMLLGFGLAITLGGVACRDVAEDPAGGKLAGLSDYIRASMADWELPGLAVAVVHGDEVVFAEGFGIKELGRENLVDAHTLFQIGSVSKSFGAALIGALVDDGLVHWDDPVVEHLPWFRVKDPEITREMTIRDLLSHQSGMPRRRVLRADDHGRPDGSRASSTLGQPNPAQGISLQQPRLRGRGAGGGGRDRKAME